MSIKVKQAITNCLRKIEHDTFDEDTIRTLLICCREYISTEGLIKELAHFIAHSERNQGMFHKKVNSRYAKFKLIKDRIAGADLQRLSKTITTEEELSDFLLGGVALEKLDTKLFTILYLDSLEDLPESHLLEYTGLSKYAVRNMLQSMYRKKNGYYYLKTNITENLIAAFRSLPTSKYDPSKEPELTQQLLDAEQLVKKSKENIDRVLKVLRGAIYFNSVFDARTFQEEAIVAISQVIDKFSIDRKFIKHVKEKNDDILLCIMTLLHDSRFTFYDKNSARTFLCLYLQDDTCKPQSDDHSLTTDLYDSGVLALYIEGQETITFPLFVSELPVKRYLAFESYKRAPATSNISRSIWTTATRVEGTLQLTAEYEQL